jgi:hypothetical protein
VVSVPVSRESLPGLQVVPRDGAFRYKGKAVDPVAAGRALNGQVVVMGRGPGGRQELSLGGKTAPLQRTSKGKWNVPWNVCALARLAPKHAVSRASTSNLTSLQLRFEFRTILLIELGNDARCVASSLKAQMGRENCSGGKDFLRLAENRCDMLLSIGGVTGNAQKS